MTIAHVDVRREVPTRAWQNQTVHLGYHLRNRRKGGSLGIRVDEVSPEGIDSAAGYCVHLPGGAVFRAGARFAPRRRGRIRLRSVRLSTSFPFGVIGASQSFEQQQSVVVWPARGRLKSQLLCQGAVEVSSAGPSPVSGGQDEFYGLREYRQGDSPRWVHWRRSAGRATPVVREMAQPLPEVLWVVLDTQLTPDAFDRRERVIRFVATLVDHAFSRGYQVGLALAYRSGPAAVVPAGGSGQKCIVLDALADVDQNQDVSLLRTLEALPLGQLRNANVIVASADDRPAGMDLLESLRPFCRRLQVICGEDVNQVFSDESPTMEAE